LTRRDAPWDRPRPTAHGPRPTAPCLAINIVTFNSGAQIDACLASVFAQDRDDSAVTVVDNASRDDTPARLARWAERGVRVIRNERNEYYARAHNEAIRRTASEFVVTLNPDVTLRPDFLSQVLAAFDQSPRIGSVNGKLLLAETAPGADDGAATGAAGALIDSAGLMIYRSRRPYLRGNRKSDRTHCRAPAPIFGADGACAAYRRAMLDDIAVPIEGGDGGAVEYFDEDFVIYREDVDLAWRAQLFGWDGWYTPAARGVHVRGFHLGRGRRGIAPELKRHSVKNGWLLPLKNDTLPAILRAAPWFVPYQAKIVAGLVALERSSLGAVPDTLRLLPKIGRKRAFIQARRRRSASELRHWFA